MSSSGKLKAFALRLPSELHSWVEAQAKAQDRSKNWVVSHAVQKAMQQETLAARKRQQ